MFRSGIIKKQNSNENVRSPLHRLQADLSRDQDHPEQPEEPSERDLSVASENLNYDNDSIYSFDSVSTSGRLLDRLDLDADEYLTFDGPRRRESASLIQSIGRSWDLPSDDLVQGLGLYTDLRQIPIRANSALGLDRRRSLKSGAPVRTLSQSTRMAVQNGPGNVVRERNNRSFDSLHGDLASRHNSSASLASAGDVPPQHPGNTLFKQANQRSHQKLPTHSPIPEATAEFSSSSRLISAGSSPVTQRTGEPQSPAPFVTKRSISASSSDSNVSFDGSSIIMNVAAKFDPAIDAAAKKALAVRVQGNHREASYQLQTLASPPFNYPKAMYLYAKALKVGQGVKLNEANSIKWLCRSILTCFILESSQPDSPTFNGYLTKLGQLLHETLLEMVKINLAGEKFDPLVIMEGFRHLGQPAINKIAQLNATDKNIVGGAYFLLADALFKGLGLASKDEVTGRLFLAKAASLAYADGMTKLGELWCSKSKHFKKDYHMASAWLRLGEHFGKQDIGNSWIYKDKYVEQRKR